MTVAEDTLQFSKQAELARCCWEVAQLSQSQAPALQSRVLLHDTSSPLTGS